MEQKIIDLCKIVYSKIKYEENKELREFLDSSLLEDFVSSIDQDIILVLWWDGTMLEVISNFSDENKAFLWINFWNKWFLMNDKDILNKKNDFKKLSYPLLECLVWRDSKTLLNEIDISSCFWRMANLDISINDDYSLDLLWDWLIISTPIWSTWYNVSLGWPIIPHSLEAFSLSPKAPRKPVKQFPILIDNKNIIKIKNNDKNSSVDIYADGILFKKIRNLDETIIIKKSSKEIDLIFDYSDNSYPDFKVLKEQGFKIK